MKNLVRKFCLICMLVSLVSCAQNISESEMGNGKETVGFSFRANSLAAGGKLFVTLAYDDVMQSFEANIGGADSVITHSFRKIPIMKHVKISGTVEKAGEIVYEGEYKLFMQRGLNKVRLGFDPFSGYVLWSYDSGNGDAGYKIFKKNLTGAETVATGAGGRLSGIDFNEKNEAVLFLEDVPNIIMKAPNKKLRLPEPGSISLGPFTSFTTYKDGVFFANKDDGHKSKISFIKTDIMSENVVVENMPDGVISAMEVVGNNIYVASVGDFPLPNPDGSQEDPRKISLSKGVITEQGGQYKISFSSHVDYRSYGQSRFIVSDLQYKDGYLYALTIDLKDGNSKGQLLKIDSGSLSVVDKLGNLPGGKTWSSESDIKNNFTGPRNFIAIKPKKLVIADDGYISDGNKKKKRVITVDLDTFDFTEVVNMGDEMFDGAYSNGCGYSPVHPIGNAFFN